MRKFWYILGPFLLLVIVLSITLPLVLRNNDEYSPSEPPGPSDNPDPSGHSDPPGPKGSTAAPGVPEGPAIQEGNDYASVMTRYHNNIREQCSPENKTMKWDKDLAKFAKGYATALAESNGCNLSHSFGGHDPYAGKAGPAGKNENLAGPAGENLAMYYSSGAVDPLTAAKKAINGWAGEGYGVGARPGSATGHYTAMNWKDTTRVGCGYGIAKKGIGGECIVTACNYQDVIPNMNMATDSGKQVKCTSPLKLTI